MSADQYLQQILAREAVNTSSTSPVLGVQTVLRPILTEWASSQLRAINPSGSFAKGTANRSGTDIDLFISLKSDTTQTLKEIYTMLFNRMKEKGYSPKQQNVSINVRVNGYDVDLVPAKHQGGGNSEYHSVYRRRADTWTQTNVNQHISTVRNGGRISETRLLKLWRDQKGLDFPSFYLELTVIDALTGARGTHSQNVWKALEYLRDRFLNSRVVDPANTNNIISDDMTAADKTKVVNAASLALRATDWSQIVI
jgi:Second Messenger Oligonucleotide or Dinucleotide Synthetase domain